MAPSSNMDPYAILELKRGCSEQEIQKAYKKQCLKWHPDKNMDNQEEAQRRFLLAKDAFEMLFDKEARAEYDKKKEGERVRDEKQRERMAKADGERKRFMVDLERREKEFSDRGKKPMNGENRPKTAAEKKKDEERARESFEEMRRRLEKEVNEEIRQQNSVARRIRDELSVEKPRPQLKVEWKDGDYDEKRLRSIYGRYGKISAVTGIIVKKKNKGKMCVVEFDPGENAWGAEKEIGNEKERLKGEWMKEPEEEKKKKENEDDEEIQIINDDKEKNMDNGEEDLSGLSFEELQERLLGGISIEPPTKRLKEDANPSWKEEI